MANEKPTEAVHSGVPNAKAETAFEVTVNTEGEKAQVMGKPHPEKKVTEVHEVSVSTDRVITDLSDPLAVQVPDKDEDDGLTPISLAYKDAKTPEEQFAEDAKK